MNKIFVIIAIIFILFTFLVMGDKLDKNKNVDGKESVDIIEERAMYVSYIELQDYVRDAADNKESKENIVTMLDDIKNLGFTWVILHVRSHSDAIYKSEIFPWSANVSTKEGTDPGYDVLKFFLEEGHKRNLEIHAWINPYRIRSTTNTSSIAETNPAYKYLNTNAVKVIDGKGIWYNPANPIVRKLIVDGIEELVSNYDIDGVHFDDYFYPNDTIDVDNYEDYVKDGGTLTVKEYRLNNVTELVKEVYSAIKKINKDVLFGIAPEGNIDNNYDSNYIDTKKILSEEGYVDYIMPQIYYGFFNETRPFIDTLNMWNSLIKVDSIKLMPALAFYKVGTTDSYAKSGSEEWLKNSDIIKKQILVSRNVGHYNGMAIFSYNYIFNEKYKTEMTLLEFDNMRDLLQTD